MLLFFISSAAGISLYWLLKPQPKADFSTTIAPKAANELPCGHDATISA